MTLSVSYLLHHTHLNPNHNKSLNNTIRYVATIGFFDGVHAGHRYLIERLREEAAARSMQSAVITFEQHPKLSLTGQSPDLLTTFDERIALLKAQHLDEIYCFQFEVVKRMTAREFMHILHKQCQVNVLLMGYDHHFGSDHLASIDDYIRMGKQVGLTVLPQHQAPEGDVSSTKIRCAILSGDMPTATQMLGTPYSLTGTVVHGRHIGHTIGFPTANLSVASEKLIPASGVYAAQVNGKDAILNIGNNPTVGNSEQSIELHIPNFSGDLYNQTLTVSILRRIRDEKKFATLDELKQQILLDIESL